jgi:hypothetical protein
LLQGPQPSSEQRWPKNGLQGGHSDAHHVFDERAPWQPCSRARASLPPRVRAPRHALPCSLRLQVRMPELPWHPALASSGLPRSPSALARPAAARLLAMAMAAIVKRQSSSQPPPCPSAVPCLAAHSTRRSLLLSHLPQSLLATGVACSVRRRRRACSAAVPPRLCAPPLPADSGTSLRSSHRASGPP